MSLHRVVAALLLVAVAVSSVEVIFGSDVSMVESATAEAVDGPYRTDTGDAGDDCACLCACLCAGAQLVVPPAAAAHPRHVDAPDRCPPEARFSSSMPSPRPPHRPPVA